MSRLRLLSAGLLATRVAATPLWTIRDVLAHVVGITADLNAQRFGDGDGDAWTLAQVAARSERSIDDLAGEWDREAPVFEAGLRLFGYGFGAHYLGDLLQHVADVEAALGRSPVRDDVALAVALDFYLESFEGTLAQSDVGALDVHVDNESWSSARATSSPRSPHPVTNCSGPLAAAAPEPRSRRSIGPATPIS